MEPGRHEQLMEATVAELRARLDSGELTARQLAEMHLERVRDLDQEGPRLRAVIEINPDWEAECDRIQAERHAGADRGPLHGIPMFVKDNVDTGDRMLTTAGSLALESAGPAPRDAPLVARLRDAGVVLLGKTNLSEWANFRSTRSSSGWSARGGQCRNPHVTDRSPAGSSSGSGVAVAVGYAPLAVGTETDGSIIAPSAVNGIVGIKPSVGLVSRQGIVPISHVQDSAGAHARSVRDAALLLGVLSDQGGGDFTSGLRPDALKSRRIGVLREPFTGYSEHVDRIYDSVLAAFRDLGAELVDPAVIETAKTLRTEGRELETLAMEYELKAGMKAYLATRQNAPRALSDLIRFNEEHAGDEMPFFRQEIFEAADKLGGLYDPAYVNARATLQRWAGPEGIDATLGKHRLDALISPSRGPAWVIDAINGDRSLGGSTQPSAIAGYPIVTVPMGMAFDALPVGIAFFGRAGSEANLLAMAFAFEQHVQARRSPRLLPTLELA